MKNLLLKGLLSLIALIAVMGLLLFVPAGTVRYWQGWVFIGTYFGVSLFTILFLLTQDPALLKRRMAGGPTAEKNRIQQVIMLFASVSFIAMLVVPGLDHRMHWSRVPIPVVVLGDLLIVIGWIIVVLVLRENSFASATIEVATSQKVISTGPYSMVRHPMYAGSFLWCLGMPLALGSWWGLIAFAVLVAAVIWRLFDEERYLSRNLAGYSEYCVKVRWRMIPGVF